MDAIKLLGSLLGNNATGGNLMGSLLGGGGGGGGGLGALAGLLGGGGGGKGKLLGALAGLAGGKSGGLGALAGLAGGAGGLGAITGMFGGGDKEEAAAPLAAPEPDADAHEQATLLIKAMCNAAKVDGEVDDAEQQAILGRLGDDVTEAEINFVRTELSSPLDVAGFVASVPQDLGQQVYAISLAAIKLDTQGEANYLGQLAQGLNMDGNTCNAIHDQLGAPKIFS